MSWLNFRDDICLDALKESGKLKLVLVYFDLLKLYVLSVTCESFFSNKVDHNVLSNSDSNLDSSVVQIVDHHKQEHPFSEMVDMLIEPVGSCSTLVASLIFESAPEILDAVSASLLLGKLHSNLSIKMFYAFSFKLCRSYCSRCCEFFCNCKKGNC